MMRLIGTYLATAIGFLAIDSVWLGVIAPDLYERSIGHLMADTFRLDGAIAFYVMFIAGILYFAVFPALNAENPRWQAATVKGGLLGALTYATYDLTNFATLKDWPVSLVYIDIAWGTFLTAGAATVGYLVASRIKV